MKNEVTENILEFILGGRADFCIVQDGKDFGQGLVAQTVKYRYVVKAGKYKGVYLVSAGEVSNSKVMYLGTLKKSSNNHFIFSEVSGLSDAGKYWINGLMWVLDRVGSLPERVHVVHNGRCAVCGRVLTDAESVMRGFGPSCAKKLGI